jgi:hypothetical protein
MTATSTSALFNLLAGQQRRVVGIVAGLDDEAMRRAVLPSGWSCAGMIQHLTRMTTFWFDAVMSGHELVDGGDDFEVADDVSVGELVERYSEATGRGHDLVRDLPLDTPPAQWPAHLFGPWRLHSLVEVLQHVLVESATHAGHLDAARELIDGCTWDYQRGGVWQGG